MKCRYGLKSVFVCMVVMALAMLVVSMLFRFELTNFSVITSLPTDHKDSVFCVYAYDNRYRLKAIVLGNAEEVKRRVRVELTWNDQKRLLLDDIAIERDQLVQLVFVEPSRASRFFRVELKELKRYLVGDELLENPEELWQAFFSKSQ